VEVLERDLHAALGRIQQLEAAAAAAATSSAAVSATTTTVATTVVDAAAPLEGIPEVDSPEVTVDTTAAAAAAALPDGCTPPCVTEDVEEVAGMKDQEEGHGVAATYDAENEEKEEDANEVGDTVEALVSAPTPFLAVLAPLASVDPNSSPREPSKPSKYSPGVVGRTQMRIREKAAVNQKKKTKSSSGAASGASATKKMKGAAAFSPRRTRSSMIPTSNPIRD
jgi:hypothetical protein